MSVPAAPATPSPAPVLNGTPENRLADLTARLRADNQRLAERAAKLEAQSPAQALAAAPQRSAQNVERAALAAIAAAVAEPAPAAPASVQQASYGDVTVRPIAQKPSLFPDHDSARAQPEEQMAPPETFIPQAAERAPLRTPRMPKFEELPMPAQAEIRQARGDSRGDRADSQVRSDVEDDHPQKRMSLLQRLANVGLGRRDDEMEPPVAGRSGGPSMPPLPDRKPQRSVSQQIAANEPVSEYARRPAPQGLDTHGRPAPVAPAPQGDDHLDIPAFLRRQAN
jgi:cell division protein FtsZ